MTPIPATVALVAAATWSRSRGWPEWPRPWCRRSALAQCGTQLAHPASTSLTPLVAELGKVMAALGP